MNNDTICPLLTVRAVVKNGNTMIPVAQPVTCEKEKCAWWVEDKQKCAITALEGKK